MSTNESYYKNIDMLQGNLFCDTAGCCELAVFFGLMHSKMKVCLLHTSALTEKRVSPLPIEGYHFVNSMSDEQIYQEKIHLNKRGLMAITALEQSCAHEFQSLHAVKELRREYHEVLLKLQQSKRNIEKLLTERDFQLSPKDISLCKGTSELSQVAVENYRAPVIHAVLRYYRRRDQVNAAAASLHHVISASRCWMVLALLSFVVTICFGYPTPTPPTSQEDLAESYLRAGQEAIIRLNYDKALTDLNASDHFFRGSNRQAGLLLGMVHAYFGNQTEALDVLQRGLSIEQSFGKNSLMALQLTNAILEVFVQFGHWRDAGKMCEGALSSYAKLNETDEKSRLLWFCAISFYNENHHKVHEFVDKWVKRLKDENPSKNSILLLTEAYQMKKIGKIQVAIAKFVEGLKLNTMNDSYIAAFSMRHLARRLAQNADWTGAEKWYREAELVLETRYPHSLEHARCLCELGSVYSKTGDREKAVEKMKEGQQLFKDWSDERSCEADLKSLLS